MLWAPNSMPVLKKPWRFPAGRSCPHRAETFCRPDLTYLGSPRPHFGDRAETFLSVQQPGGTDQMLLHTSVCPSLFWQSAYTMPLSPKPLTCSLHRTSRSLGRSKRCVNAEAAGPVEPAALSPSSAFQEGKRKPKKGWRARLRASPIRGTK